MSVGFKTYTTSAGIEFKHKVVTNADGSSNAFAGFSVPGTGDYGVSISGSRGISVGRFKDPRLALRAAEKNQFILQPDSGISSKKPVPATTGGSVAKQGQSYEEIKNKLLASKSLFEDSEFPACDASLFYSRSPQREIDWKRPSEICKDPKFISEGLSRFDIQQGELGDCWLLAAVACLSIHDDLIKQVVPSDQSFQSNYCGIFLFRFWRFGEWVEVFIDDRLPTYRGKLMFMHSSDNNEFWSALLEKAYAKLSGSYESLKGGSTSEALEDFTGGLTEMFDLRGQQPPDLEKIMLKANKYKSLMACSIDADPNVLEAVQPNGLVRGHAYSITGITSVEVKNQSQTLIRIRNPWGNECEWTGRWSDKSPEWTMLSQNQRRDLGLTFDADGEFWMSFQDFVTEFQKVELCCLGPQSLSGSMEVSSKRTAFECCVEHGSWQRRISAGGCRNYIDTFWTNPQFRVTVVDPDEDDDEDKGTLIVGLMQMNRRKMRKIGADLLTIGYIIYKLNEDVKGTLDIKFFKSNQAIARSPAFINLREVSGRHRLSPGTYVIIPSTFNPNEEADFILRMFSEKPIPSKMMDEITEMKDPIPANLPEPINDSQLEALQRAFNKVAGSDQQINANELRDILNVAFTRDFASILDAPPPPPPKKTPQWKVLCCGQSTAPESANEDFSSESFTLDTCRTLIAMMDVDRSGSLDFEEFRKLWELLRQWKSSFKKYDVDKSGSMDAKELRNAIKAIGFSVCNDILSSLILRFSKRDGSVFFDDYVNCCARLRIAFEIIKAQMLTSNQPLQFSEISFLNTVIYF